MILLLIPSVLYLQFFGYYLAIFHLNSQLLGYWKWSSLCVSHADMEVSVFTSPFSHGRYRAVVPCHIHSRGKSVICITPLKAAFLNMLPFTGLTHPDFCCAKSIL